MCRDRHPEIFQKSGQIWQNDQSGRDEIWQFGFSQGPGGAGIHLGGSVLMSGPKKLIILHLGHLGVSSGLFSHYFHYLEVPPGPPIGTYCLLGSRLVMIIWMWSSIHRGCEMAYLD